jgi:hypothetical protein
MGRLLGTALPNARLTIEGVGQSPITFCRNVLAIAATAFIVDEPVRPSATELAILEVMRTFGLSADAVADMALRWYIRDWAGAVPVPPTIRQAASAAWLADHPEVAYDIVKRYAGEQEREPQEEKVP